MSALILSCVDICIASLRLAGVPLAFVDGHMAAHVKGSRDVFKLRLSLGEVPGICDVPKLCKMIGEIQESHPSRNVVSL